MTNVIASPGFAQRVAEGLEPYWSFDRVFGSIDSVQADTPATVWEYGETEGAELYTFSADGVADIDTISSDNADDDTNITIVGLDVNGDEVTQTITLDGQNKSSLTTPLWRVNHVYNPNGTTLQGNVYVYVDGDIEDGVPDDITTVRGYMSIGEGESLQAIYTVPNGKIAYFRGIETSITKGAAATPVGANLRGRVREYGKVFRTKDEFNLLSTGTSSKNVTFPIPLPFLPKTDFYPLVDVSKDGVGVSWAFSLYLKEC